MRATPSQTKQKRKLPNIFDFEDDETFESLREFTGGIKGSLKKDLAQNGAKDFLNQVLGKYEAASDKAHKLSGDLHAGEEISLSAHHGSESAPTPKRHDIQPGLEQYNYYREIVHSGDKGLRQEAYQQEKQVEEILVEIQRLVSSSKVVEAQFASLAVEQKPKEVGKYHTHFFDWVLTTIRQARMKVEDSGAWLASMSGKKGKKNYWSEFKKHGTSFGMSNERSVATQTG